MNLRLNSSFTGTGEDQELFVPRDACVILQGVGDTVEVRDTRAGSDKLTLPADIPVSIGPFDGQTIFLRAAVGVVIQIAFN